MNRFTHTERSSDWIPPGRSSWGVFLLLLAVVACSTPAPRGIEDVDDIPIPSQDIGDDDDSASGDDDDTADDDDDATGDDDDSASGDDDDTADDDDDDVTPVEPTSPIAYTLSDAESLLYIQVFKDTTTWGAGFAHDHVMRATNWTGSFDYDPADLTSCTFQISIPVSGLLVDEDGMRDLVGYGDTINASDRATIQQNMTAADQLNSVSFSQISVVSQTCGTGSGSGTTNGNLEVTVDMTLRGVTQPKSVVLDLTVLEEGAYVQGSFNLTATEFGFSPYQFLGGGVRNLDQMTVSFDMIGLPIN